MGAQVNFFAFLPTLILSLVMAIPAGLLARDKGRNVFLWVVLAVIPLVNFAAILYFIGTPDRRVNEKLGRLLQRSGQ